jgi:hypothetical protein
MNRAVLCILAIVALAIGVGAAALPLHSGAAHGCVTIDWARWRQPSSSDGQAPTPRQKIARQALKCKVLLGKSRHDIRRSLGRPDQGSARARRWHWITGPPAIPIDTEELVISFAHGWAVRADLEVG